MNLKFRDLELSDKPLFDSIKEKSENSKFSFAQSFVWKDAYKLQIAETNYGYMFLSQFPEYGTHLVSPILFDLKAEMAPLLLESEKYLMQQTGRFLMKFVSRRMADKIEQELPGRYRFEFDQCNSEYIYATQSLTEL